MSRSQSMRTGMRALLTSLVLTTVFAAGSAAGIYLYPRIIAAADDHDHDHASGDHPAEEVDDHVHEDEEDHVALTRQAYENLDLRMGPVRTGDFWKTLLVPARVVEIPGRSDLSVSAPVAGVVEQVQILPGQSLTSGTPLFVIRLTDQALIDAQSKLLETLTRQEVASQEVARLNPLTESGAVSGARLRELEYELQQLQAQRSTLLQELRSRGLPQSIVAELLEDRVLASTLTVAAPSFVDEDGMTATERPSFGFSVEDLLVHPGKSVSRGELLCSVAYHSKLYIEGTAFEDDLHILDRIAENSWQVAVESPGPSPPDANSLSLDLLRIDNHVDEETQTVKFFVELPNQVTRTRQADGRLFEQWQFRPGQRLHLRLPVEHWINQITLPADAVVVDGPNVFVFAEHHHHELPTLTSTAASAESLSGKPVVMTADDEHDVFIELEPIPVRLLYRTDRTIVIADDGQLTVGGQVALNNAYKLYLAMKMQSGGGGHHHDHDH